MQPYSRKDEGTVLLVMPSMIPSELVEESALQPSPRLVLRVEPSLPLKLFME